MNYEAIPIIRIELERMKHQIVVALGAAGSELGERIDAEIQRQIEAMPWENMIRETILDCVGEAMKDYFKWGKGRRAIEQAITEAFEEKKAGETQSDCDSAQ